MDLKLSAGDFAFERKTKIRDTYQIGHKVGEGAFSSVRSIKHRQSDEKRALKTIHKKSVRTEQEREMVFTEVSILQSLDHPNILRLHEFYQDEKNYYIITEFCQGGELFDLIINSGSFSEASAANYMRQILGVVNYLHERRVVHRDLKPENLLMSSKHADAHIKVVDFGSSQWFREGEPMRKKLGTPYYIAPEVLNQNYTQSCDLWSCGVIMYILICGYPPFPGNTDHEIIQKVKVARFSFPSPEWDEISFEAKDLIEKLLTYAPHRRINARDALQHPWLAHASHLPLNRSAAAQVLNNLKNFRAEQKLKKATLSFISAHLATQDEREGMMDIFKAIDTDMSGTLSEAELREGFARVFGDEIEDIEGEVQRIMKEVDYDQSGEIDYSEFVTATLSRQQLLSKERLEQAFSVFDMDESGTITAQELKEILGKHKTYDDRFWADIIREADLNGDGEIDLQEFMKMMLK